MSSRNKTGSATLYVRNITDSVRHEDLRRAFGKYGHILDVNIPIDYYTQRSRGFCFIEFEDYRDAEDAADKLDRTRFMGRDLEIEFARGNRKTPSDMRSKDRRRVGGSSGSRRDRYDDRRDNYDDRRDRSRRGNSRSRSPRRKRSTSRSAERGRALSIDRVSGTARDRSPPTRPLSRSRSRSTSLRMLRRGSRGNSPAPVKGHHNPNGRGLSPDDHNLYGGGRSRSRS